MFAAVRQYKADPGSIAEMMRIVDSGLAEEFAAQDGFVAYEVLDCGDGQIISITTFRDQQAAKQSSDAAANFVRDNLSQYKIERTGAFDGEVTVSRATSEVLEPAHA
jgi:hypothetical protein